MSPAHLLWDWVCVLTIAFVIIVFRVAVLANIIYEPAWANCGAAEESIGTASPATASDSVGDSTKRVAKGRDGCGGLLDILVFGEGMPARAEHGEAGGDDVIAMDRGGSRHFYLCDGHGNVAALTDSTGAVVERYRYDAYGRPTFLDASGAAKSVTSSDYGNPLLFQGRNYDPETGLYNFRARYYSPALGRFLSRDPNEYADATNLYQYCLQNPGNLRDPEGELIPLLIAAGLIAVPAAIAELTQSDVAASMSPAHNIVRAIRGEEYFSGEQLSGLERGLAGADVAFALVPGAGKLIGKGLGWGLKGAGRLLNRSVGELASEGIGLAARMGKTLPIPLHASTPWYKYLKPSYEAAVKIARKGRSAAAIARTEVHEAQHVADIIAHPQLTHLIYRRGYFPGAGLARYWFEYRGYRAAGHLKNILTPLKSMNRMQKANLGLDLGLATAAMGGLTYRGIVLESDFSEE